MPVASMSSGSTRPVDFAPNIAKIMERKNRIVATQAKGIQALFKSWGVTLLKGNATIKSSSNIEISASDGGTQLINADRIIIATGSRRPTFPHFRSTGSASFPVTMQFTSHRFLHRLLLSAQGLSGVNSPAFSASSGAQSP